MPHSGPFGKLDNGYTVKTHLIQKGFVMLLIVEFKRGINAQKEFLNIYVAAFG